MATRCKTGLWMLALSIAFCAGRVSVKYEWQQETIATTAEVNKVSSEVNRASDAIVSSTNDTVNKYIVGVKNDEDDYHTIINNINSSVQQQTENKVHKGNDCEIPSSTRSNTTPSGTYISRKDIENLIEIGKECNQVVRQLNACQSILLEYKALADSLDKNR